MLRVAYEAADLNAEVISDWHEDRGLLKIRVARHAKPKQFTQALNRTLADILESAHWYQVWRGEVISIASPTSPLRVHFAISDFSPAPLVDMRERKGLVTVNVSPDALVDEFVQAINAAVGELLAGGQWFQLWRGEIVTMDSPDAALV